MNGKNWLRALLVASLFGIITTPAHADGTVKLGMIGEYSGPFADYGQQMYNGMKAYMLLHGDIRADNLFFDGDQMRVVDFQFAARGSGAADIAYLVTQGLPSRERAGHDEVLLRHYLDQLADFGVTDYGFDEAWRQYRCAAAYLMVLPVITLNGWDVLPERSRQLCLALTDRAIAAIDQIDALEVVA